jgi:hypothetical protein
MAPWGTPRPQSPRAASRSAGEARRGAYNRSCGRLSAREQRYLAVLEVERRDASGRGRTAVRGVAPGDPVSDHLPGRLPACLDRPVETTEALALAGASPTGTASRASTGSHRPVSDSGLVDLVAPVVRRRHLRYADLRITPRLSLGSRMGRMPLTSGDRRPPRPGMIVAMSLRLLYLIFQQVLGPVLLMGRTWKIWALIKLSSPGSGAFSSIRTRTRRPRHEEPGLAHPWPQCEVGRISQLWWRLMSG